MPRRPLASAVFAALLACNRGPYPGACEDFYAAYCDTCGGEYDFDDAMCTCVEEETLTAEDLQDDQGETACTDAEADRDCGRLRLTYQYPMPDTEAECRRSLELMEEYEEEACLTVSDDMYPTFECQWGR